VVERGPEGRIVCRSEIENLEGSVRSRGENGPLYGRLIEAGLNEAAGGLALWG
jgi:hypothetical protein